MIAYRFIAIEWTELLVLMALGLFCIASIAAIATVAFVLLRRKD